MNRKSRVSCINFILPSIYQCCKTRHLGSNRSVCFKSHSKLSMNVKNDEQVCRHLTFVTGNQNKLREVIEIFNKSGVDSNTLILTNASLELPELQGEPEFIAKEKCLLAAKQLRCSVLTEDTSLCYNALNGLPGPYIKWFLDKIGLDGLNKIIDSFEDKSAYAQTIFAYCEWIEDEMSHDHVMIFRGKTDGIIVNARGENKFGWDPIFQPNGFDLTYSEMSKDLKNSISHRSKAFAALIEYFTSTLLSHNNKKPKIDA
mmetsp:Transcript_4382/g.7695  ORF Transcript_4382/g.7695 Transcript_4382/m.7695 type:complete len:258 (+) Transcript_4382:2-775(+)